MIKNNTLNKSVSVLVCLAVILCAFCACGQGESAESTKAKGESVTFTLKVIDSQGEETVTEITTDEETVGAALEKEGIIEGEQGPYGLYVKTVNGITADYDKDKTYWAFYINDEYASVGIDLAKIEPNAVYTLKVQK